MRRGEPAFAFSLAIMAGLTGFGLAAEAADAARGRVVVARDACAGIVGHTPAPGVQYEPGRDVRGRAVAPADAGGGIAFKLPDTISIDLGIDLAAKYGLGDGGRYKSEGSVGTVTVTNGRAYLNGQPLDAAERNAIAEACRNRGSSR